MGQAVAEPAPVEPTLLNLELRHTGRTVARLMTQADPTNFADLRRLMLDAARRHGGADAAIGSYEMDVRDSASVLLCTVVA